MYVERHVVTLTTDASGAATGYTPVVTGRQAIVASIKKPSDSICRYAETICSSVIGSVSSTNAHCEEPPTTPSTKL